MNHQPVLYGISNCDTIKKAKNWLVKHQIEFSFHDFRKSGLDPMLLQQWVKELGYEPLLNKRGTTWRQLAAERKDTIDASSAIEIMLDNPAIIKRPVLIHGEQTLVGFSDAAYSEIFG